jgi:hypothetical protein
MVPQNHFKKENHQGRIKHLDFREINANKKSKVRLIRLIFWPQ